MTTTRTLPRIAVAGNPNTGKTTLFNRLTGSRGKVGNYPGVTVDRHFARLELAGYGPVEVMDVPGTYSLAARSREEQLALQAVAGLHPLERPDLVVVVLDATQLVRNLYLALQLIELGVPVVCALNMTDRLPGTGQEIDPQALARELGVPVVALSASKGTGLDELRTAMAKALAQPEAARPGWCWEPEDPWLESDVKTVAADVPDAWAAESDERRRALALWALLSIDENDELEEVPAPLRETVLRRRQLAEASGRQIEEQIIRGRYDWLDARAPAFLRETKDVLSATDRIDRVLLHPLLGPVFFLGMMTLVFQSLFAWADPMIGWIEGLVGVVGEGTANLLPPGFFNDLMVEGVVNGVGGVLVFLPQILLLFFFMGLLEDTGYMARVAWLVDRVMRSLGLSGRAFVPMLSGFACAVPAILATRTMERRRDRLLTMLVVPLMTCSARLPVYGLLIAAVLPVGEEAPIAQGLMLTGMYVFSTVVAMGCAAVLGRTILKGPKVPFVMEMPAYRMPHWPSVARMMWQKSAVFLKEAGTVILACTVGMWLLLSFPSNPELEGDYDGRRAQAETLAPEAREAALAEIDQAESSERLRKSYAGRLGTAIEPTLEPLGFDWQIGIGILGAFAAREVFVSTMAVVYGLDEETDETSGALRESIRAQTWPDGRPVYTPLVCFSLMVFFALACQCMSTLAVVKRETAGYRWPVFLFVYMTALAWGASFVLYQGGRLLGWA